jgi:sphingolipid 4-desaturase/C4-monooxygenase
MPTTAPTLKTSAAATASPADPIPMSPPRLPAVNLERNADGFYEVDYPEPHRDRARYILKAHPEVKKLVGRNPWSFAIVIAIVAVQTAVAVTLGRTGQPWWVAALAAWGFGAFANHALWVLIHETSHNLIFKKSWANRMAAQICNLSLFLPTAESFRIYHLRHHQYQGDYVLDADLSSAWEAKLVGQTFIGKLGWEILFPVFQSLRTIRLTRDGKVDFFNAGVALNWILVFGFDALVWYVAGPVAVLYLFLGFVFSIGPHPVGARWIQEHFIVQPPQETYSYYGPLNVPALNVGYHNEHHDFPSVPWNNLPKLKALAPEMYEPLYAHKSWTGLWVKWLTDPTLSLFSRVTRDGRINGRAAAYPAVAYQRGTFEDHADVRQGIAAPAAEPGVN